MNKKNNAPGGKAVAQKAAPEKCPRCSKSMKGRSYHSYLGHLGLHGLADRYFDGDIAAAQKQLRDNGRARSDPFPGNGAWRPYRVIVDLGKEVDRIFS